jgi:hypothetical protein
MPQGLGEPSPSRSKSRGPDDKRTKDELSKQLKAEEESRQLLPTSDPDDDEKPELGREHIDTEYHSYFNATATDEKYMMHMVHEEEKELRELQEMELEKDNLIGELEGQEV